MKLKLVDKRSEAKDTKSFFWKTEKKVVYLPGQFFYFTLPKLLYHDPRGATRHFTLSSSSTEGATIRFTTKMRKDSGYKKTLGELEIGSHIAGEGPNGTFILDENEPGPHVFLAGGIGITPFRSMIKYAYDKGLKEQLHLIYANSTPEEIAFKKEFDELAKKMSNFDVDYTISRPDGSLIRWKGLTGRIDEKMITHLTSHLSSPTFWICGPPAMVDAMEKTLGKLKVTSDKVRSEKFSGY